MNQNPEQLARNKFDHQLTVSGWILHKYKEVRKIVSGNIQKALNKEKTKSISFSFIQLEKQQQIIHESESGLGFYDKIQ